MVVGGGALEKLLRNGEALVSKELARDSSRAGDTVHLHQEANTALKGLAMETGGHDIGGLVQVDNGLPKRGVNHAAEGAKHLLIRRNIVEAPKDVV
jgi:hypothetical protein